MKLNGEVLIAAPRETVWRALGDPKLLARYFESPTVTDRDAPYGCTISGQDIAVKARLSDAEGGTLLSYEATANTGGKFAKLGGAFASLKAEIEQPEAVLNPANDASNNTAELAAARLRRSVQSDYAVPETLGLGRTGWLALALVVIALAVWWTL